MADDDIGNSAEDTLRRRRQAGNGDNGEEEKKDDIDAQEEEKGQNAQENEPTSPSSPQPPPKICRICYGEEDPALGRLFSPCLCKGSMKHVHVECLNNWRKVSTKTLFQCELCKYRYNIQRTQWAWIVSNPITITAMTILVFIIWSFLSGFLMKIFLRTFFEFEFSDPQIPYNEDDMDVLDLLQPHHLWLTTIDIFHFILGIILVGVMGMFRSIFTVFTTPLFPRRVFQNRGGGGRNGNNAGLVLFAIIVLVGVGKMVMETYKFVRRWSEIVLQRFEERILEVD